MKKYLFVFAFTHFLLASCCKTDGDHINKFTCKVNGVFWEALPNQRDILGNDLQMDKSPVFEVGYIRAWNERKKQAINISAYLDDTAKTGIIREKFPYGDYRRPCNGYFLDTLSKRVVTVTDHDKVKRIVRGTFAFRAIDIVDSCKDTVTITDGFFDMQY
jgi:hypothetical protein